MDGDLKIFFLGGFFGFLASIILLGILASTLPDYPQLTGVVSDVRYVSSPHTNADFNIYNNRTEITFEDGRTVSLKSWPAAPIPTKQQVKIRYSSMYGSIVDGTVVTAEKTK